MNKTLYYILKIIVAIYATGCLTTSIAGIVLSITEHNVSFLLMVFIFILLFVLCIFINKKLKEKIKSLNDTQNNLNLNITDTQILIDINSNNNMEVASKNENCNNTKFTSFQPPKTNDLKEIDLAARKHSDKMFSLHQSEIHKFNPEDIDLSVVDNKPLTSVDRYFLKYLNKLSVENPNIAGYWTYEYNIDYKKTITKFMMNGYLEISTYSIGSCTVAELKEILKDNELTVSGKKSDLINRIIDNNIDLSKYLNAVKPTYILTEKGINETKDLLPSATKNTDLEDECLQLISQQDFNSAYKSICKFEASKNLPRGIGIDWNKELEKGLSENKVERYNRFFNSNVIPNELQEYEIEIKSSIILGIMLGVNVQGIYLMFYRVTKCHYDKRLICPLLQQLQFDLM